MLSRLASRLTKAAAGALALLAALAVADRLLPPDLSRYHDLSAKVTDADGRLLRASLADAGVDVTRLRTGSDPTGTAIVLITPDGDNSIVVSPGANGKLTPEDVRAAEGLLRAASG